MYLMINNARHECSRRIVSSDTIKYLSVTPAVEDISGKAQLFRDDGFLMAEDNLDSFERKSMVGTTLTVTNAPEVTDEPRLSIESRVAAIEEAIERGLGL